MNSFHFREGWKYYTFFSLRTSFYDFDLRASHARTLLPAALASVPFGFVLVRVRIQEARIHLYQACVQQWKVLHQAIPFQHRPWGAGIRRLTGRKRVQNNLHSKEGLFRHHNSFLGKRGLWLSFQKCENELRAWLPVRPGELRRRQLDGTLRINGF